MFTVTTVGRTTSIVVARARHVLHDARDRSKVTARSDSSRGNSDPSNSLWGGHELPPAGRQSLRDSFRHLNGSVDVSPLFVHMPTIPLVSRWSSSTNQFPESQSILRFDCGILATSPQPIKNNRQTSQCLTARCTVFESRSPLRPCERSTQQ